MARGNSRAQSERGDNPFNSRSNDPKAEISDQMEGLLGKNEMPDGFDDMDENTWDSVASDVADASDSLKESERRDQFDELVDAAQNAIDNPSELSTNLEDVAYLVPLTAAEAREGKRPYEILVEALETAQREDGGYDAAVRRDKSFRDNDGSFEETWTVNWIKDFLAERVADAPKERKNYDKDLKDAREVKIFEVVQKLQNEKEREESNRPQERDWASERKLRREG